MDEIANILLHISEKLDILIAQTAPKQKKARQTKIDSGETLTQLIEPYKNKYAESMIKKFVLYWDQKDRKGVPLWKKKEVFQVASRLASWQMTNEEREYHYRAMQELKKVEEKPVHREPVMERVDRGFQTLF